MEIDTARCTSMIEALGNEILRKAAVRDGLRERAMELDVDIYRLQGQSAVWQALKVDIEKAAEPPGE